MQAQPSIKKPGFLFWLLWTLVAAVATAIFLALNVALGNFDRFRALWMAGILPGLLHGLIIRRAIRQGIWWAAACAASTFLAGLYILLGGNFIAVFVLLFAGLVAAQCWLLGRSIRRPALWLLVNGIALVLTALITALPLFGVLLDASGDPVSWAVLGVISGGAFGAVTGLGLLILLRYPLAAAEGASKTRLLTPANILVALLALALLIAPVYAILQVYALQSHIYCAVLQPGMPRAAVNEQIGRIRPFAEHGAQYGYAGDVFPYPESLKPYAAGVVNFYTIELQDLLVAVPEPGLGYDAADNLALISSDNRNYDLMFQVVKCPWTWQATWDTLFK